MTENIPEGAYDAPEEPRFCGFCGENVIGKDFLAVGRWQFYRYDGVYLTKPEKPEHADEFLCRACIEIFCEGQFARLHSDASFPEDRP